MYIRAFDGLYIHQVVDLRKYLKFSIKMLCMECIDRTKYAQSTYIWSHCFCCSLVLKVQ